MSEISLKIIDKMIEDSVCYNSPEKYLTELAKLIIAYFKLAKEKENIDYKIIVNRDLKKTQKRFVSFVLLRIYSKNCKLLTNSTIKHKIHKLFEESIPDIYKYLKIDSNKIQTYEIESILSDYVESAEKRIETKLTSRIDLQFIDSYGKEYRSTVNGKHCKALLSVFSVYNDLAQQIDNAFKILIEYNKSDPSIKYKLYDDAIDRLDDIIQISEDNGTKYSIDFIQKPFSLIRHLLVEDLKNNPYSRPASLFIEATEKKYPFIKNVNYKIQLLVRNESTGHANDTNIRIKQYSDDIIKLNNLEQYVGTIKKSSIIEFEYDGLSNSDSIIIMGEIEWINFNHDKHKRDFDIELKGQKTNINWSKIKNIEPYDLEPVTNEDEFIGRSTIINNLKKIRKKVTSSYIYGQRRVGKTSIVKTLQTIVQSENILVIYIEAGDWDNATSAYKSMSDLGRIICKKIIKYNKKFSSLEIPNFEGSFNRLTEFLDEVTEIDATLEILIVLDEFDRISSDLLSQGNVAQSFMLTIRSISNREQFGFILVGGEKLEYLLSQWQEFNKFKPIRVDYFDKELEWEDFKNLIKIPVNNILEITDKAIDFIYSQTSGNPYFTKKICIELFELMVSNRDNHVTEIEARKATDTARYKNNIGATDFSHFWKDGIKEKEEKEEEISIHRRKILLSIGQLLRSNRTANKQNIIDYSMANGLDDFIAEKTLEDFIQRKVIEEENNKYKFVVKFFEDWLIDNGIDIIITTFKEEQQILLRKQYEDELSIKSKEINELSQSWKIYKGKEITTDIIRNWLDQFSDLESKRLIFKMLQSLKLYTNIEIREHLEGLFVAIQKEIRKVDDSYVSMRGAARKRGDILVSYLDKNPSKSGAEYAKIFIEENNIYKDNSTVPERIGKKLSESNEIKALLFVDDILGSGSSVIDNLKPIMQEYEEIMVEKNIIIIIGVITGFQEAKHRVEEFVKDYKVKIIAKIMVPLDKRDKCFSETSSVYTESLQRKNAMTICRRLGSKLENKNPLGYDNCQAIIVFPNTCPNNSLPILWKKSSSWNPLFERR